MKRIITVLFFTSFSLVSTYSGCNKEESAPFWNEKYSFIKNIEPVKFHYGHGVLAGSYPDGVETTVVDFNDVSRFLGHVCLCGAGGFKISKLAVDFMMDNNQLSEKGDFILISSNDHTVSDVIAYVLGCSKREDKSKSNYFIDTALKGGRRVYNYFIGYPPEKKAVNITYRKHLLVGNDFMDKLWAIETGYENNPSSISNQDIELYRDNMFEMIHDVLFENKTGLFEIKSVDYGEFQNMLNKLR